MHTHNLGRGARTRFCATAQANAPLPVPDQTRTFESCDRTDGKMGVLTTVNCSATVAKLVAEAASRDPWSHSPENIDGIVLVVHDTSCAIDLTGEGFQLRLRSCRATRSARISGAFC